MAIAPQGDDAPDTRILIGFEEFSNGLGIIATKRQVGRSGRTILAQSNDRVLGAVSGRATGAIGYADELMVEALEAVMGAS